MSVNTSREVTSKSDATTMLKIRSFINGEFVEPSNGQWLDNYDPAVGEVFSQVADSPREDVDRAVAAASLASREWSRLAIEGRSNWLNKIADGIQERSAELAAAECRDSGKPLKLARDFEIPRAAQNFRFFASLIAGSSTSAHDSPIALNITLAQPWGVGGTISPWNLPLYLFTWKVAPALAAGNCVVAKPSEVTPYTASLLGEICQSVGLPPGVLNIVQGSGGTTGQALVEHPGIRAVSFTGGTATGAKIAAATAPLFKKVSLELGGKNPNIIFADCDFEKMLATTFRSSFQNQGQICLCGSRILVERSIYERFRDAFVSLTERARVGDPLDESSDLGAVVSRPHQQKILAAIERAKQEGGRVLTGGTAVNVPGRCANGWFVAPTIIENLAQSCSTNQQEIFGPVVTLQPFDNEPEALSLANDVPYGLSATVWTSDVNRALRVAEQVQTGVVWVNGWLVRDLRTPFGGMKESGVGREGGLDSLEFWTQKKNICLCRN
ncbi:MAG: aldehyde dehydrogenase [Pirellulaceae bacterium]|nr:aldehyde dehydrogenase [Pirellulaceae bacterium]